MFLQSRTRKKHPTRGYLLADGERVSNPYEHASDPHLITSGKVRLKPVSYIARRLKEVLFPDKSLEDLASYSSHAELKAAAIVKLNGLAEATVVINHPGGPCAVCRKALPYLLDPDTTLTVVWPNGSKKFPGVKLK